MGATLAKAVPNSHNTNLALNAIAALILLLLLLLLPSPPPP